VSTSSSLFKRYLFISKYLLSCLSVISLSLSLLHCAFITPSLYTRIDPTDELSIESGKCRLMAYVKDLKYVELDLDGRLCEPDVNFGSRRKKSP